MLWSLFRYLVSVNGAMISDEYLGLWYCSLSRFGRIPLSVGAVLTIVERMLVSNGGLVYLWGVHHPICAVLSRRL